MKLSTVIMTFNEEAKIERCINSVIKISDEIVVLDSYSSDKTVDLAEKLGATIYYSEFLGYIKQRELTVSYATHDLVLALDADEFLSEGLSREIEDVKNDLQADAYFLNRMSSINHVWIKHGSWFPHRIIRLFKKDVIQCVGTPPHDKIVVKAGKKTARLKGLLMHHCNEDIHDRIVTINKHSTIAARQRYMHGKRSNYFRILIKPIWKFVVEYFLRFGFLDGFYGLVLAKTHAYYIYLRESKLMEHSKKKQINQDQ